MCVNEFNAKSKTKRVKFWPICNSNTINKILNVLIDQVLKHLPPFHDVDHKNEMVINFAPTS
jgi:hypothetical protein